MKSCRLLFTKTFAFGRIGREGGGFDARLASGLAGRFVGGCNKGTANGLACRFIGGHPQNW